MFRLYYVYVFILSSSVIELGYCRNPRMKAGRLNSGLKNMMSLSFGTYTYSTNSIEKCVPTIPIDTENEIDFDIFLVQNSTKGSIRGNISCPTNFKMAAGLLQVETWRAGGFTPFITQKVVNPCKDILLGTILRLLLTPDSECNIKKESYSIKEINPNEISHGFTNYQAYSKISVWIEWHSSVGAVGCIRLIGEVKPLQKVKENYHMSVRSLEKCKSPDAIDSKGFITADFMVSKITRVKEAVTGNFTIPNDVQFTKGTIKAESVHQGRYSPMFEIKTDSPCSDPVFKNVLNISLSPDDDCVVKKATQTGKSFDINEIAHRFSEYFNFGRYVFTVELQSKDGAVLCMKSMVEAKKLRKKKA